MRETGFGGFGFTSRMWGLTLDVVVSATVVLSNGTIARASNTINPELFWVSVHSFSLIYYSTAGNLPPNFNSKPVYRPSVDRQRPLASSRPLR